MKKKLLLCGLVPLLLNASPLLCSELPSGPVAKLCANCHTEEPGVMMGFLENISLKSKTLQMNFLADKEVLRFDDNTAVKNVKDFKDIRNYLHKGFSVNYEMRGGEKFATEINRFDILKTIEKGEYKVEKVDKDGFKKLAASPGTMIYDVRPPMLYKASHLPNAKPLPAPAFDKFKDKLPADKNTPMVVYGVGGCLSPTIAFNLKTMGYENVSIYTGGFPDWSKTDYTVTTAEWLAGAIAVGNPHVLIDLRDAETVKAGHIKGAVGIPLAELETNKHKFPEKKNAPIILFGSEDESRRAADTILSWGYRSVSILPVSFESWQTAGNPQESGPAATTISYVPQPKPGTISIDEFENLVDRPQADTLMVDVRNPDEYEAAKIEGSINIPVDQMASRLMDLPEEKNIVLFCPTGVRASMAQNVLEKAGRKSRYLDATLFIDPDGSIEIEEN